ncbi:hypothetical protein L5515_010194 [Caenorhabditis briggsae]|uniref:Uncharacterized protein n=1 Tax=Caenorhabditis briggsae TaxID=6238 RepID=A0AAE9JFM3_CAEBR|nr:hypothetical protein L5515_010194 [Caenorhabditis briggsae]
MQNGQQEDASMVVNAGNYSNQAPQNYSNPQAQPQQQVSQQQNSAAAPVDNFQQLANSVGFTPSWTLEKGWDYRSWVRGPNGYPAPKPTGTPLPPIRTIFMKINVNYSTYSIPTNSQDQSGQKYHEPAAPVVNQENLQYSDQKNGKNQGKRAQLTQRNEY